MYDPENERAIAWKAIREYCAHVDGGRAEDDFRWECFTGLFVERLKNCRCFVDCGAEFGFYTYLALKHAPAGCRIHAFEPEPVRFEVLAELFRSHENVTVWPYALSNVSGRLSLYKPGSGCSVTMDAKLAQYRKPPDEELSMECRTLDELLGGEPIDLIKMDIEGAEVKALEGMRGILAARHALVFIEIHPAYIESIRPDGLQCMAHLLASHGYRAYAPDGDSCPLSKGRVILSPRPLARAGRGDDDAGRTAGAVTVALCLHNRARYLPELVAALERQQTPPPFEVLCVLNRTPPDISEAARTALSECSRPTRFVEETDLGLSRARNRAIAECRTPWLAFLDDDAIPDPDWLRSLLGEAIRLGARVAGGRTVLRWDFPRPEWFVADYDRWLSCVDLGPDTRAIRAGEYVVGANMLYDVSVFADGLHFDTRLGRRGGDLLSNEELALQEALRAKNISTYYVGSATVHHVVQPERVQPEWVAARVFAQGRSWHMHHSLQADERERAAQRTKNIDAFWEFVQAYPNYRPENWHLWMATFARYAGYLWALANDPAQASAGHAPATPSTPGRTREDLADAWGFRQFDRLLGPRLRKLKPGTSMAIFGAGIAGKWVYDLCEQHCLPVVGQIDDFEKTGLTPAPVVPIRDVHTLRAQAVVLATLTNTARLRDRLTEAGYEGPIVEGSPL